MHDLRKRLFDNRREPPAIQLGQHFHRHCGWTGKMPATGDHVAIYKVEIPDSMHDQAAILKRAMIEMMKIENHILPFKYVFGNTHWGFESREGNSLCPGHLSIGKSRHPRFRKVFREMELRTIGWFNSCSKGSRASDL